MGMLGVLPRPIARRSHGSGAIRANGPSRLERMRALRALVLQLRVAVGAHHVVALYRITASGAFAVLHQLPLLQEYLELLLVAIDLEQRWPEEDVRYRSQERDQGDDAPDVPRCTPQVCIFDDPDDREDVQYRYSDYEYRDRNLDLRRKHLRD